MIGLSQIFSTLQIISYLVRHKPTKWTCDNQLCYNIYIYIYIYILNWFRDLILCLSSDDRGMKTVQKNKVSRKIKLQYAFQSPILLAFTALETERRE